MKPLPRLIDLRDSMRRRENVHNTVVADHVQIELSSEGRRLLWSYYQTGDFGQFSRTLHYLTRLAGL